MGKHELAGKSTICDIIEKLDDPEEYLRSVLENMLACRKKHGTAFVRIGTTGRGIAPHYQVAPEFTWDSFAKEELLAAQFVAFHGRSHKQFNWGIEELQLEHWSDGTMSFDEVQNLLGSLRGFSRKEGGHA